jgi:radical SAM protein with 4Fe4S-binding SPASM domain
MTELTSKTFCILPWVHFNTSTDGKILACCQSTSEADLGNIKDSTIAEIWHSKKYQDFRQQILRGDDIPNCRKCYEREAAGIKSFREISNEEFAHLNHLAETDTPQIKYLELRFSNICNLACKTCGPAFSSSWNKYSDKKYTLHLHTKDQNIVDACRPYLPHVEKIHISGGEPVLHAEHYDLLKELIATNRTDVFLSYNSNLTVLKFKDENIIDYWKQFKKIKLNVSLDGIGEKGEYIRTGSKWNELVANIQTVQEAIPHIRIFIAFTMSIFNVYHAADCFLTLFKLNIIHSTHQLLVQFLDKPDFYNINLLNTEEITTLKKRYMESLDEARTILSDENYHLFARELDKILSYLEVDNSSSHRSDFPRAVRKVDKLMGGSFLKTFPELAPLYMSELIKLPLP